DAFGGARLNAAGRLDSSVGSNGVAFADFYGRVDGADDILIQPDGSIVLLGAAHSVTADAAFAIARLTSAGVPDTALGGDGTVTIDIAGRSDGARAGAAPVGGS